MMPLDMPPTIPKSPPALVRTVGFSADALYLDQSANKSLQFFKESYSLNDGRGQVHSALERLLEECWFRNWDGYGAEPISESTYRYAYYVVEALPQGFPMPTVGVEADGHVTLEWYRTPSRVVSLSISPEGDLHYAALLGGTARRNGTEPFLGEVPADLLQIVRRVMLS